MAEVKFQEEKLRLQQKHDDTVQKVWSTFATIWVGRLTPCTKNFDGLFKILDRKNREIEDLKLHYRTKTKEHEGSVQKLEKKGSNIVLDKSR